MLSLKSFETMKLNHKQSLLSKGGEDIFVQRVVTATGIFLEKITTYDDGSFDSKFYNIIGAEVDLLTVYEGKDAVMK